MAQALKCDRCGKLFPNFGDNLIKIGSFQIWQIKFGDPSFMSMSKDLCPDCAISFAAWWERGYIPREVPEEPNKKEVNTI